MSYGAIPTDENVPSANVTTVDLSGDGSNVGGSPPKTAEWRVKLGERLESPRAHLFILGLIALDIMCVLTEIVMSLFEDCGSEEVVVGSVIIEIAEGISLFITVLFFIEIILTFVAFGPGYYTPGSDHPHWFLHCLDLIVIATTLVFEIVLRGKEREVMGLLIIFRFWRIIKVMEAVALSVSYEADDQRNDAVENFAKVKADLERERKKVSELSKQLEKEVAIRTKLEDRLQAVGGNAV